MAATNFTPISLYYSTTAAAAPTAGNLVAGELAINTNDGVLYYKDSSGVVQSIASKSVNSGSFTNLAYTGTLTGGTGVVNLGSGQFYKDASGNVGIGTSSPWSQVSIGTPSGGTNGYFGVKDTVQGGDIRFGKASGVTNNGILGVWSNNDFLFYTNSTERMRIDSSGNLLVGTSSTIASTGSCFYNGSSGYALAIARNSGALQGNMAFINGTSIVGGVNTTTVATVYATSSDYRLKEDINPMTGALAVVAKLKPVTYKWKSNGEKSQGFIAHELQAVVPDCVAGEKDAVNEDGSIKPQGIDTSFLVATLTSAIQEQQALIESLTTRLTVLEAK